MSRTGQYAATEATTAIPAARVRGVRPADRMIIAAAVDRPAARTSGDQTAAGLITAPTSQHPSKACPTRWRGHGVPKEAG
ncbi:hypothetical protein [Streptomyces sp. G-G2]|uniref:hypothetical protein n=1 Tax=Streptomyces sp. G-G2 TaxID=3046201 RepID=UPI0024BA2E57|nr:hypothetical protein [Streptomyces sp. G-G2]MDJ0384888.1 hypothetical protein [Streptomyces sp. G-G2]